MPKCGDERQRDVVENIGLSIASLSRRAEDTKRNVEFLMEQTGLLAEDYRRLIESFYWRTGDRIVRVAKQVLGKKEGQPIQRLLDSLRRYNTCKQEYADRREQRETRYSVADRHNGSCENELARDRAVTNELVRDINKHEACLRHIMQIFDEIRLRGLAVRQSIRWRLGARVIGRIVRASLRSAPLPIERRIDRLVQNVEEWIRSLDLGSAATTGPSSASPAGQQTRRHGTIVPLVDLRRIRVTQFTPPTSRNPYYSMIPGEMKARNWNYDICADRQAIEKRVAARELETEIIHFHQLDPFYHFPKGDLDETRRRAEGLLAFMSALKRRGARLVMTAHNPLPHHSPSPDIDRDIQTRAFDLMDALIVLGQTAAREMRQWTDDSKIHVVPHPSYAGYYGNAVNRSEARRRLGLGPDAFILGNLGEIKPYKGLEEIVGAFRKFKEISRKGKSLLVFCGNPGPDGYVSQIQAHAAEDVLVNARHIPDDEIPLWLGAMDVAVFAFEEIWMSGSVALAMSYLVPPIVPATGCLEEYVIEQDTGFVYRHRDVTDLANAMKRVSETPLLPHIRYMCNVFNRKNSLTEIATMLEVVYANVASL